MHIFQQRDYVQIIKSFNFYEKFLDYIKEKYDKTATEIN